MKKVLLGSVATGALALTGAVSGALTAGSANAADLRMPLKAPPPPAPVFSWSGCYVGANWGWGWGKKNSQAFYSTYYSSAVATSFGSFSNQISGPVFGGQIGCNYQWPGSGLVIGIQGDYDAADINGWTNSFSFSSRESNPSPVASNYTKVDGIGSVTGRLGWNGWDPQVLFYVKGGWAWAHERDIIEFYGPFKNSRSGWTVGGGVEWALSFAPKWSVFAEYDYYSFGHKNTCFYECSPFSGNVTANTNLKVNVVKVGINYRLFSPF
jgi:outer membrane immunogenic protein